MTMIRTVAITAALAGAAVGLAGPVSADPLDGTYTAMAIKGPRGAVTTTTFTPCGPDCVHLQTQTGAGTDLHLQGNSWTGILPMLNGAGECTESIDKNSLVMTHSCGSYTIVSQLTKNG